MLKRVAVLGFVCFCLSGCVVYRPPICPPGYHLGPLGERCWSNID